MKDFEIETEIDRNFKKEVEKSQEESKLTDTINLINKEVINYIDKRKHMSDYIREYRKNVIEEYRDDEDKIVEYFDHERFVTEESFRTIDRRLKELLVLVKSPYFGKVNYKEMDSEDKETIYIGRFGMTPEGAYEPVVVDWRAPVSALFYSGMLGVITYKVPMGDLEAEILSKRQFIVKKGKLAGMFDSAVDVKDEILQMVLSANSSEKLKDIIMTIQEEQDKLIRQQRNKTIVVTGVAGSGKTTIALHRVAYLLYNYRDTLQDKVLILGPNSIFMEYISTVLPSLGEVGVKQKTFNDFAMEVLNLKDIMTYKNYIEKVFGNDENFINEILYKNSSRYTEFLDDEIEKLDNNYFEAMDVSFKGTKVVSKEDIKAMFSIDYKYIPLFRRSKKIKRVVFSKIKDARDEAVRAIEKEFKDTIKELSNNEIDGQKNNLEYNKRLKIKEIVREVLNTKESLRWLENPIFNEIYIKITGDKILTVDDLAPMLYLKLKLEGVKLKEEIKHVVIDEAQDYSELQFKVIKELTKCISMTVVGDVNQRLIPVDGEIPMLKLDQIFTGMDVEHFSLDKSYRSTREIMNFANNYLKDQKIVPLVRNGEEVVVKCFESESLLAVEINELSVNLNKKGYESVAIVCRDLKEVETLAKELKQHSYIKVIDREEMLYNGGTVLLPSYYAKGLEFDVVIVVEKTKSKLTIEKVEDKIKYIMCTRALHELYNFSYNG